VVADLVVGDYLLVRPGEIVPADGKVVEGVSHANEALLTGESRPVVKQPGDRVTGGSVNTDSPLVIQVEQVGQGTRLSAIIELMERASLEKPKIVELADRIAVYFVGALLVVAALTALGWYWVEPSRALWVTVSVLVVTCPCALALATPIALTVAAGSLARDGLLVTRGHAIETLARATHFVFDKTGTLTSGRMQLRDILPLTEMPSDQCLAIAAALEQSSEHPLALALLHAAPGAQALSVVDAFSEAGQGVEAVIQGRRCRIGRPEYALALSGGVLPAVAEAWLESGDTVVLLADENGPLALFKIGDVLRPEAAKLVSDLRKAGKKVVLLTGDAPAVARRVAGELGIEDVRAGVTPAGKHACVTGLQQEGAVVCMVGDGVNDAPVLAQAQVSVAMGGGAQLARTQSDFVLLSENLGHLHKGLGRAGFTLVVIWQNLWWSFAYNIVALPAAIAGYVTPWMAGIGMSLSSLLVVLNSLRIQRLEND
jgi:Cu2+-exporting ATPase